MRWSHNRIPSLAFTIATLVASPLSTFSQGVVTQKQISLDMAQSIAQAAVDSCRAQNYHIVAIVLDPNGMIKVMLRDEGPGPNIIELARRKAFTALSHRRNSSEQAKIWETQKIPNIGPDQAALGGGVPIKAGNDMIGALGVGGAPGDTNDEACALAAVTKYADKLK
jgi:uncharacterized protein GlcG (DUF336 family)